MTDLKTLMTAVRSGNPAILDDVLDASPDLALARNANGVSAICLATYLGQPAAAQRLARDRHDLDIFDASVLGWTPRVRDLVSADPDLKQAFSADGFQPLGYACFFGHHSLFDYLLSVNVDVNTASRNTMSVRPLHSAAAARDPDLALYMVRALLARGADVNATQQGGYAPLHEAAHRGLSALIKVLLATGADKRLRNDEGNTPAALARSAGHHHLAQTLSPEPAG